MMSSTTRSIALSPPSLSPPARSRRRSGRIMRSTSPAESVVCLATRTGPIPLSSTHPGREGSTRPAKKLLSPMNSPTKRLAGRLDVERGSDLFDLAVAEHGDAIGHRHGLGLVVRDVDHRDADLAMDALDLDLHLLAQVLVERAQRLVEQKHIRIEQEAARERDPLLLAAG